VNKDIVSKKLDQLKKELLQNPGVIIAVVYGSYASGTAKDQSDLDLGIALSQAMTPEEKVNLISSLSAALNLEIDSSISRYRHTSYCRKGLSSYSIYNGGRI